MGRDAFVHEQLCPHAHLDAALDAQHPLLRVPAVEDSLAFALRFLRDLGPEAPRWRRDVVLELRDLMEESSPALHNWYAALEPHVQDAYAAPNAPAGFVAVPILLHLGDAIGYPVVFDLCADLTTGFPLLGAIPRGTGWETLDAPLPAEPTPVRDFLAQNAEYSAACMDRRPDEHGDELLRQVLEERRLGRVYGPYAAPASWGKQAVPLPAELREAQDHASPLLPAPECAAAALAFSITTYDDEGLLKVRRGEDWRRSGHNATTQVCDRPHYHTIDAFAAAARAAHHAGFTRLRIWGHDHDGAYRQCALSDPEVAYFVLPTRHGPLLFKHSVLMFGAKGAVWGYGRLGDAIVHISRCLLATPSLHFVDDYGGVEPEESAASGFESLKALNEAIGFRMKPSKEQPPAATQVVQGVLLTITDDGCTVAPKPSRLRKVNRQISVVLHDKRLTPTVAGSLAGKTGFLATSCFGKVGRAAVRPLFARQHVSHFTAKLTIPISSALHAIMEIFATAPPRDIPFHRPLPVPVLYADAFFEINGSVFHPRTGEDLPGTWNTAWPEALRNGWGFVLFPADRSQPIFAHGEIPGGFLKVFAQRKAYIFVLEALAQCIPLWALHSLLAGPYWAFVDNDAARHALAKGYSGNLAANTIVSAFWATAAAHASSPWFERVSSAANIADAISRGVFDDAARLGWRRLHLDLGATWQALANFIDSGSFNVAHVAKGICRDLDRQLQASRS